MARGGRGRLPDGPVRPNRHDRPCPLPALPVLTLHDGEGATTISPGASMTRLPSTPTRPSRPSPAPSLEARLAAAEAEMNVRLDEAAVAYEVNTAHIATGVDLDEVITTPVAPEPYRTPVAALLQRAHHRLTTGGWCAGAFADEQGARCLWGAIRAEAGGDAASEADAVSLLLDTIRRAFGSAVDSVPSFNDAFATDRTPLRMLERAAQLADARGL